MNLALRITIIATPKVSILPSIFPCVHVLARQIAYGQVPGVMINMAKGLVVTCDEQTPYPWSIYGFFYISGVIMFRNIIKKTQKGTQGGFTPPDIMLRALREVKRHYRSIRAVANEFELQDFGKMLC